MQVLLQIPRQKQEEMKIQIGNLQKGTTKNPDMTMMNQSVQMRIKLTAHHLEQMMMMMRVMRSH